MGFDTIEINLVFTFFAILIPNFIIFSIFLAVFFTLFEILIDILLSRPLAAACDGDFGFSPACVATAFYILILAVATVLKLLVAACVDDLGFSIVYVASTIYIFI